MAINRISELKSQFISGDVSGLKTLYHELRTDVMAILISKATIDPKEAESYFSSALVIFYENVTSGKVENMRSIKNYISGIALNLIRQEFLIKTKTSNRLTEIRLLMYNSEQSQQTQIYRDTLRASCKEALGKLNTKCKRIIVSYYIDGLSMNEIAKALKLSSGDVAKTLKRRCYKTLVSYIKQVAV